MNNNKKRILLIYPPSPVMNREDRCQQPTKELVVIPPLPPMDLMYLAAISEQVGFEAKIEDYSQGGSFEDDLKSFMPDFLVINVAMPTLEHDLSVLDTAKKICPDIKTITKGATFLTLSHEIMQNHKNLDMIIKGEAEYTLKEILEGKAQYEILGLCYREGADIRENASRPFIENL